MIPEEDRGPAWLQDYGYTDFGQIEADIEAMKLFAAKLSANVQDSYAPHLSVVSDAMMTRLPDPPGEFVELSTFLTSHNGAQEQTHKNVYYYAAGTEGFARAASDIGEKYSGSDAFSHARVSDVDAALTKVGLGSDPTKPATSEGDA